MKNTSRKPYIYKVTNLETGEYYIGSQCSGKTIGTNYFTSSTNKAFKEDFKAHGEEKYEIVIIRELIDPDECVRVENYMIRDHMLLKDGLCLNLSYFCNGEKIFSRVGLHHSEETKQKMSLVKKGLPSPKKGIPRPEETKQKISIAKKGIPTWNKGITWPEETKQKMRTASKRRIKISIEDTIFSSIREASKQYNVGQTTIRYWVKNKKRGAFYIEK